jgi:NitT/TauT family transport system permease protein
MANNFFKKTFWFFVVLLFWVGVWWLLSIAVEKINPQNAYLLPSPAKTLDALFVLFKSDYFYRVIFHTFLRVLFGLTAGISVGAVFALISHRVYIFRQLITPLISVIKAMPVATFILLLWLTLRGSTLTVFIGFIMVMPVIYQNLLSGLDSIDKGLLEVTLSYEFSPLKKFKLLTFPTLLSYLAPAVITSVGLAFKSQIAAEIIAYTGNSIGRYIYDANYSLQTPLVFAWAVVIVSFSIGLESLCRYLFRRVKKHA